MTNKKVKEIIIPVLLESYFGGDTRLEVYPSGEMWLAVHVVDGKVVQGLTDCGYSSLEELKDAYKDAEIMEIKKEREVKHFHRYSTCVKQIFNR